MQSRAARGAAQQHFVHSVRNQFENDCKLEKPVHARDWTARRTGARCVSAAGRHTMARARRSVKWRRLAHHDRGSDSSEWGFSRRTINSSGSPPRAGRAHIAKHVHKQNICRAPLSLSLSLSLLLSRHLRSILSNTRAHARTTHARRRRFGAWLQGGLSRSGAGQQACALVQRVHLAPEIAEAHLGPVLCTTTKCLYKTRIHPKLRRHLTRLLG